MSQKQRERGIMISYLTLGVNAVIALGFTPFITHMLGKSELGLYTAAQSIISFMTMLDLGFGNSMIRFNAKYRADGDEAGEAKLNGMFLLMFSAISLLAIAIGAGIYFNIEPFFKEFTPHEVERAKLIFLILLVNICLSFPFTAVTALLSAYERFTFLKTYYLVTNVLTYGAQAVVLLCGCKSVAVAAAYSAVNVLAKLVPILYIKTKMTVRFEFGRLDPRMLREVLAYSAFVFLSLAVDRIYADTDKILLGRYVGTAAVSVYGVAATLNKDAGEFSVAISGVFLPSITKLITQKAPMREISDIFIRIARVQFLVLTFIFGGFLIFGKRFIHFWVGDEYLESYYIALLLMAPGIIPLSQNIGISVIQAMNKHRARSVMYVFIALFNIGVSIPLIKLWGGVGAAIGTMIGNLLGQWTFMNWYYHRKIGLDIPRYWTRVVLRIGVVVAPYTAAGYLVNRLLPEPSLVMLAVRILVYCLIFAPAAWFAILNREEKDFVLQKLRPVLSKIKRRPTA